MEADELLRRCREVAAGWDGFKAPVPKARAVDAAHAFLTKSLMRGLRPDRVEPSVVGGVGITYHRPYRDIYVEFHNSGKVLSVFSRLGDVHDEPEIQYEDSYQDLLDRIEAGLA